MKIKLLVVAFVAVIGLSNVVQGQLRAFTLNNVPDKISVTEPQFTLGLIGIPGTKTIQVFFAEDVANKIDGVAHHDTTLFVLDDFLEDLPDDGGWFFVYDKKNDKRVDSFMLVKGEITDQPHGTLTASSSTGDIPIAFYDAQTIFRLYKDSLESKALADLLNKYNFIIPQGKTVREVVLRNPFFYRFDSSHGQKLTGEEKKSGRSITCRRSISEFERHRCDKICAGSRRFFARQNQGRIGTCFYR